MKLIIKHYLASLRERGELDAVLPDLLSQMGLNVFSKPRRGTRQDGVDVAAYGRIDREEDCVYLYSIKGGDLTRGDWDGQSPQSLRPSLNEILDAYIENRLPAEHRDKTIVVCIAIGGDIQEQVRPSLEGFVKQNTTDRIRFETWNGDKIASHILESFLSENLLTATSRGLLRKSLALLDEPEVSFGHYAALMQNLSSRLGSDIERLRAIRQVGICLWILFAWARDTGNLESAYRAGENAMLHAWAILQTLEKKKCRSVQDAEAAFTSIFMTYISICDGYLDSNITDHVGKRHALSCAVGSTCELDVNLRMFDVLGRVAMRGLWARWMKDRCSDGDDEFRSHLEGVARTTEQRLKSLINNNPVLFRPIQDQQAIDIALAVLCLAGRPENVSDIRYWIAHILERATFAYRVNGKYPCILGAYTDLLSHPDPHSDGYREKVTGGSILYPSIALWAAALGDGETVSAVAKAKEELFQHCNFQFWYPGEDTESSLYTGGNRHGATMSDVPVELPIDEFLDRVFGECDQAPHGRKLSAIQSGWWPLVLVACRHHRQPVPIEFFRPKKK